MITRMIIMLSFLFVILVFLHTPKKINVTFRSSHSSSFASFLNLFIDRGKT